MKKILTLVLFLLVCYKISAQLSFNIYNLNLSNVIIELKENIIDEDLENGPYIGFECIIENFSDSIIIIYPSNSKTNIIFRFRGKEYITEVVSLPFVDKDILEIMPKQKVKMTFGTYILLGTTILNNKQEDYTKEMLEILPTLKVNYKDNIWNMQTCEVINVIVH